MGKTFLRNGVSVAAILVASLSFVTNQAGGAPGHGRGGAPGIAHAAPRGAPAIAHAAPRIGAIGGGRHFSAPRITGPSAARFTGAAGVHGGTAKLPSNS